MGEPEPADIGRIGELYVVASLRGQDFKVKHDTRLPGASDIEARSAGANRLVQVKTALTPNHPDELSPEETQKIKTRAARLGWQAWLAQLTIDANGKAILNADGSGITWKRLL
jgi:hypothetical protein